MQKNKYSTPHVIHIQSKNKIKSNTLTPLLQILLVLLWKSRHNQRSMFYNYTAIPTLAWSDPNSPPALLCLYKIAFKLMRKEKAFLSQVQNSKISIALKFLLLWIRAYLHTYLHITAHNKHLSYYSLHLWSFQIFTFNFYSFT